MSAAATATTTFYKLDVQGIVYLIDPATATAYTYDLADPTPIGKIIWSNPSDAPRIELFADWSARLDAKLKTVASTDAAATE
jgi:hypothetical protein